MTKNDLPFLPVFFDRYINLAEEGETLISQLEKYNEKWLSHDLDKMKALNDSVYAEGKWTMKTILQHLIDTERIMAYRALRISRNDKTPLPGFEENDFAQNAPTVHRTVEDLIEEFGMVRKSSILLFKNMSNNMLLKVGTTSNQQNTALALGFVLVGHAIHHLNVVKERYFSLL